VIRNRLVVAEDDASENGAPLARRPADDRAFDARTQLIRQAAEPAATSGTAPRVRAQDDMDALAREPLPFVEAAVGTARLIDGDDRRHDRALGRGTAGWELQQRRLVNRPSAEAHDDDRHAHVVAAMSRGRSHLEPCPLRCTDLRRQHAPVQGSEPDTAPPPARQRERDGEGDDPPLAGDEGRGRDERDGAERERRRSQPGGVRRCNADAERTRERVRRPHRHGATRSRSSARRFGPIPGIASSSSTLENAPCSVR
jgi:hypothetical protein